MAKYRLIWPHWTRVGQFKTLPPPKKKCVNLAALKFSETVDDAILVFPKTDKIKIREKNFFFWGKREIEQSSSPSVSASLNGEKV